MSQSIWYQFRDEVKSSHSCVDFLRSRGFNVSRPGQAIITPAFIRQGSDSKSFAVYDNFCIDYTTNQRYDVIDLAALSDFNGDLTQALEYLAGRKLPRKASEVHSQLFDSQAQKLAERFDFWHSELLKNPIVNPSGHDIHILDYLHNRGLSDQVIAALKLGYSPKSNRLMIPFFNRNHLPCYYSGRLMAPVVNGGSPKYSYLKLDHQDFSEVAYKCIFGIDSVRPGVVEHDTVFDDELGQVVKLDSHHIKYDYLAVCEGMFDVLSFRAEGWSAITGKISSAQEKDFLDICRMFRDKGQKIFICFDSDKAGQNYQRKIADLLFKNGIDFVAGHLPMTITVTRQGRPDFGQEVHIKDVSDYYAAGGSLEELVKNAADGMKEIADNCKDIDALVERFHEAGRVCDKWHIQKLKKAALTVVDYEVVEETDKDGNIFRDSVPRYRFNDKEVKFLYSEAVKPLQDCDIAKFVEEKYRLIYDTLGQFYEYRKGVWQAMNDLLIEQQIIRVMNGHISAAKVTGVCKFLKMDLAENVQFNTKHNVVFQNGTLWLDEPFETVETVRRRETHFHYDENGRAVKDEGAEDYYGEFYDEVIHTPLPNKELPDMPANFRKHSPEDMSTIQVSYNYDPLAHNEALERAVRQWTNHPDGTPDEGKYRLVKQMFGYILFVKNTLQKFFILKGDGANGKSTCMHCIEAILGRENTTSLQLSRLSSEFDPIVLKNSRVNLCYDAQASIEAAQETLKALIGGDQITAAHKGVDAESFTTNAKFIVSANKFFSANDVSRGLLRRMLFIAFNNTFEPKAGEDNIEDEIMKDLPGLFNFAYEGYKDLKASGYFVETDEQKALLEEFKEQLSPLILFAREELYKIVDAQMTDKAVYFLYAKWCKDNGEKALGRTKFIPEIRQVIRTDGVIAEPVRDKDTKQWIFTFPAGEYDGDYSDQPQDEKADREGISAHSSGQEVQEVSTSNEEQENTQFEESAPVHTGAVYGAQAEQKEQHSGAQEAQPRKSSGSLQKIDDPVFEREYQRLLKIGLSERDAANEAYSAYIQQRYHSGVKVVVPDKKDTGFMYDEDLAYQMFRWLKNFGRGWMKKLYGTCPIKCKDGTLNLEFNVANLQNLGVFMNDNRGLWDFLPGLEEIFDFSWGC